MVQSEPFTGALMADWIGCSVRCKVPYCKGWSKAFFKCVYKVHITKAEKAGEGRRVEFVDR